MNTKKPTKKTNKKDTDILLSILAEEESKIVESNRELQAKLDAEKDARREERFLWVFAFIILLNALIFSVAQNLTGPIVLGVFEVLFLILLGKKWGVENAQIFLNTLLDRILSNVNDYRKNKK